METLNLNQDEFAKFIANKILEIENYNFDVLYDIAKIMNELRAYRGESEKPMYRYWNLMLRSTGCDLVEMDDPNQKLCEDRSIKIFFLKFCWNTSYFTNETVFCEATRTK